MYNRYRSPRKGTSLLPKVAIGIIAFSLLLWLVFAKGGAMSDFFRGERVVVASNDEANAKLTRLLGDLYGDKAHLLDLAANERTRLGWISNHETQLQVRSLLVSRLIDSDLWTEATALVPEILPTASVDDLDRIAAAAAQHKDLEMEQKADRRLQEELLKSPLNTELLLRSIRRAAEGCIAAGRNDEAVRIISVLDGPAVMARLNTAELAVEAASLQMLRAGVCEVKEPVLQQARNILEKAKWPACEAASHLMLDEVSNTLRDNPRMNNAGLKELEEKLLRCRKIMMEFPDHEHRLPDCYRLLGDLRIRLGDYEGCAKALSLAAAFIESYGEMTPKMELELRRVRTRANVARGAEEDAVLDYKWLLDHETEPAETFKAIAYLIDHTEDSERAKLLERCWNFLDANPRIAQANAGVRFKVADALVEYYSGKQDYPNAIKWLRINRDLTESAHPNLTDGEFFQAKYDLALMLRKAKQDGPASAALYQICEAIEKMSEADRDKLDAAAPKLYRNAVREYARTRYIMNDTARAKAWVKKIKEGLPDKER